MKVLDLFSAAAGGWSLGLHRAGFQTLAACEWIAWRRALYAENNPGVLIYDDVRTLTGERLLADVGAFPDLVAGSPPCQDISSANTKGKGVDGERSGLYFEAIRIIGEVQRLGRERGTGGARWVALENSSNLRTRGADRVLGALESLGYTCWSFVVGGDDVGANHQRKRSWIVGVDLEQLVSYPHGHRKLRGAVDLDADEVEQGAVSQVFGGADSVAAGSDAGHAAEDGRGSGLSGRRAGADTGPEQPSCRDAVDAAGLGHEGGRPRRHGPDGDGSAPVAGSPADADRGDARDADKGSSGERVDAAQDFRGYKHPGRPEGPNPDAAGDDRLQRENAAIGQMGLCATGRGDSYGGRSHWSLGNLAGHVWLDARLQAWAFLALLLEEGSLRWAGERLIAAVKSAAHVERPSIDSDLARALRTVLAFYSETTARRLAPIAGTLSDACNITLEQGASWEKPAKSAKAPRGSPSTTSTRTGPTTPTATSKHCARPAIPATICELDLWVVHRQAERRLKLFASRHVEAFGDAVLPQIPEAIGRAILRVEAAYAALHLPVNDTTPQPKEAANDGAALKQTGEAA